MHISSQDWVLLFRYLGPFRRGLLDFYRFRGFLLFVQISVETLSHAKFSTEINYVPDCMVASWEGPQLLLAKVKNADGQDWYICFHLQASMNTYEVMTVMLEWVSEVHLRHTITEQPTKPLEVFNNPEFVQGKCLRVRRVQNMSDHHQPYFCATRLYIIYNLATIF